MKAIRKTIRARRRAMSQLERKLVSAKICDAFTKLDAYQHANSLAGFLAFDGEADPMELMIAAHRDGKRVYVPMIVEKANPLLFLPWEPDVAMKTNSFGIDEPEVPRSEWITGQQLDLVITPLVAFDANCHRIGVGGGYYDRTFSFLRSSGSRMDLESVAERSTKLIGFAMELQRVEAIELQPWDVVLDSIVTEEEIYRNQR